MKMAIFGLPSVKGVKWPNNRTGTEKNKKEIYIKKRSRQTKSQSKPTNETEMLSSLCH